MTILTHRNVIEDKLVIHDSASLKRMLEMLRNAELSPEVLAQIDDIINTTVTHNLDNIYSAHQGHLYNAGNKLENIILYSSSTWRDYALTTGMGTVYLLYRYWTDIHIPIETITNAV